MVINQPLAHVSQLPIPVPLPVHYTNCYILETSEGMVLIDTGMDTPEARALWEQYLSHNPSPIRLIIVTHFHPDHLGLAFWLQQRVGAPVAMMRNEAVAAQASVSEPDEHERQIMTAFYEAAGVPRDLLGQWMDADRAFRSVVTLPSTWKLLDDGQILEFSSQRLVVMEQGGHTDHQGLIYLPQEKALFTGDQVLSRITPNVSLWPLRDPNPLNSYLTSLERLQNLGPILALPAHEAIIANLSQRIDELFLHHETRTTRLLELVQSQLQTAFELTQKLFTRPLNTYQMRFALGETLAHLAYLEHEGRITRDKNLHYRLL